MLWCWPSNDKIDFKHCYYSFIIIHCSHHRLLKKCKVIFSKQFLRIGGNFELFVLPRGWRNPKIDVYLRGRHRRRHFFALFYEAHSAERKMLIYSKIFNFWTTSSALKITTFYQNFYIFGQKWRKCPTLNLTEQKGLTFLLQPIKNILPTCQKFHRRCNPRLSFLCIIKARIPLFL